MPIVQNIPRKQGRIQPSPKSQTVNTGRRVFPAENYPGADVGDVVNPGNPNYLTLAGKNFSVVSSTGGAKSPTSGQLSTASQVLLPPMAVSGQVGVVPQHKLKEVQPHEHGTFFADKGLNTTATRQSGGVSPTSDSAFHPVKGMVNRPRRYPTMAGERTSAESFGSMHTLSAKANHDVGGSRWSQIKRGAAEAPVPNFDEPNNAVAVLGPGNTWIGSRSKKLVNKAIHVGGGGFKSPFSPRNRPAPFVTQHIIHQRFGVQPNEVSAPFPIKQKGCTKGCK
jgi:hypothetical protein